MKRNWLKYSLGIVACFLLRLIPFRPPNLEPLMATAMPFSKQYGYVAGFSFGFLSIALFDAVVGKLDLWTLIMAFAYGIVGLGAAAYLSPRRNSAWHYLIYSVIGTVLYDALTGLTVGPLMFGQPFMDALVGQVPFTIMHLAGNAVLAVTVSPFVYRWIVMNSHLEFGSWSFGRSSAASAS